MMKILAALFSFVAVARASAPGTWEPLDEDMDIMGMIEDEAESVALIQKDSRLQAGAKLTAAADCASKPKVEKVGMLDEDGWTLVRRRRAGGCLLAASESRVQVQSACCLGTWSRWTLVRRRRAGGCLLAASESR